MTGASAAQVSRALRDGYETMMRFGVALGGPSILYRGLWPTYLAAPLGAAAATSALLGLDETRTAQALALALLQVSGAAGGHAPGKASRWLLAGFAARAGATAALMVGRGYAADVSLLDGDWLQRTHGLAFDPAPFAEVAPILQETSLKPWCAAKQTIAAIDAFRQLLAQGVSAEQIQSVRVETPNAYRAMITGRPPGRLGRILNVGWQFGLAAYRPDGLLDLERAPHADDARVEALASKVEVVGSEALDALYPARWPAKVILKLADGSSVERMVTDALGDSAAMLDPAALLHKFTQVAGETCAAQLSVIAQQPVEAVDLAALDLMLSKALSA
jgi:2-methylcitrate dehydratase PrpD